MCQLLNINKFNFLFYYVVDVALIIFIVTIVCKPFVVKLVVALAFSNCRFVTALQLCLGKKTLQF